MSSPRSFWLIVPLLGVAAIVQTVVGPRLAVAGVRPDLILLVVIARALIAGGRDAVVWGFVGGLWMDILSGGPMGASSLGLMAAALLAGIGGAAVFRRNLFVPVTAAVVGSLAFSLVYLGILRVVGYRFPVAPLFTQLLGPGVLYNGLVMLAATPLLNRIPERAEFV